MRGKNECRACGSTAIFQALDLGYSPLANRVIPKDMLESAEPWVPLVLRICRKCHLGQLGEFATDGAIFRDYPYLSSTSSTWLEENKKFADEMIKLLNLGSEDLVMELASNDGYLLQYFMDEKLQVLGVEPALNVAIHFFFRIINTKTNQPARNLCCRQECDHLGGCTISNNSSFWV